MSEFSEIEDRWRRQFRIALETPRLHLRPFQEGDASSLADIVRDPEVCRFLWDCADTVDAAEKSAELMIRFDQMRNRFGYWAILDKASGELHGWTELSKLHGWPGPSDEIALSYVLRRASWGRGIATEAAQRMMRHVFDVHKLDRLMAMIMSGNDASRRVLEKLGMREVLRRETDAGVKLVFFGIEADAFRRTAAGMSCIQKNED